jgi:WhiB family redox-sensing transcriptional regulator
VGNTSEIEGVGSLVATRDDREPWRQRAACRGMGWAIFFWHPPPGRPAKDREVPEAAQVCARCDVRPECRAFAESLDLVSGWWGGVRYRNGRAQP